MRTFKPALAAALLLSFAIEAPALADSRESQKGGTVYTKNGKTYCRHSDGTTGLIVGGVGGAVAGNAINRGGLLGTAIGAAGGAFAGRAVDRTLTAKKRCR